MPFMQAYFRETQELVFDAHDTAFAESGVTMVTPILSSLLLSGNKRGLLAFYCLLNALDHRPVVNRLKEALHRLRIGVVRHVKRTLAGDAGAAGTDILHGGRS